mmetsp:Transcript_102469/g.290186  ORF Transcript_102469/g.290186 Transcript_102469/m.290186 type:complete len:196 (-) Transcript_102469:298-885(-)
MFILVKIDDSIPIPPTDFGPEYQASLKRQIGAKYVDRVIPNVGLCIEFYSFDKIKEAFLYPGDNKLSCGEAYIKVKFTLVVFRPDIDEWIVGSIADSSADGLRVTLGFMEDVEIPPSNLRQPLAYEKALGVWVWEYENPETKERINYFYEKGELLRFRVAEINFPEVQERGKVSSMKIVGAVDTDGLGCISWWPH